MDRKTQQEIKKAEELMKRQKLGQNPENKEYWELKKEHMEEVRKKLLSDVAEIDFLVECYEKKLESF